MAEGNIENKRLFERIGDHYNNPEMADRILVVKVRQQGWEKLEAANLATSISKKSEVEADNLKQEYNLKEEKQIEGISLHFAAKCEKEMQCIKGANMTTENMSPGTLVDLSYEALGFGKGPESAVAFSQMSKIAEGQQKRKCGTKRKKNNCDDSFTMPEEMSFTFEASSFKDQFNAESDTCQSRSKICEVSQSQRTIKQQVICENYFETCNREEDNTQALKTDSKNDCTQAHEEISQEIESTLHSIDDDLHSTVLCELQIHVHSFWLALNSSYFRGLFFSSGMKETRDKKVVMNVSENMSAMFMVLIESLYRPDVVLSKSVDDLLMLMRLSHAYDADATLKNCQRLLATAELSIPICDKALNMHELERLPEMEEFTKRCEQFVVEAFSPLDYQWTRVEFFSLSANALHTVLGSNELCVSSENTVFLALMRWAEMNEIYDAALEPLLDLVRFKVMTINYLHDVVTSAHPIAATVSKFPQLFEEAVFFHAFSKERQVEEGDYASRKDFEEPILFNWHVENYEDTEFERKKKIVKSPHFWVSGYEMFLELKLRSSGYQGLYLTICTQQFHHNSKGFVKLKYSLSSNFLKATHVFNEVDIFDKEGSGWGYEEFFPLLWPEFRDQLKRTPLIITAQVRLLE